MGFEFSTAQRIVFGPGSIKELAPAALAFGKKALIVVGKSGPRSGAVIAGLEAAGVQIQIFHTPGEPTVELVQEGVARALTARAEMVISIGGGSTIDTGKAISAVAANPGDIHDYLEVIGKAQPLRFPSRPFIAIPTTAGTGSEVTRNAVLTVAAQRLKVSLRGPTLLPRLAIVDPELTYSAPPSVTAAAGMDAMTQLIEPFVSIGANAITDAICREGLRRAVRSIRSAYADGTDATARADMALAALFSGMALANAKLGAAHGLAGPIGGLHGAPHGAVCGRLLPKVVQANVAALRRTDPDSERLRRFDELARILTEDARAVAEDSAAWLERLSQDVQIPGLRSYGMVSSDFPEVVLRAGTSSSMKGNPVALTETELTAILEASL